MSLNDKTRQKSDGGVSLGPVGGAKKQAERWREKKRDKRRLHLPVGDGGFVSVLMARDVLVQVGQATSCRLGNVTKLIPRHHVGLQVVGQRTLRGRRQEVRGVVVVTGMVH